MPLIIKLIKSLCCNFASRVTGANPVIFDRRPYICSLVYPIY